MDQPTAMHLIDQSMQGDHTAFRKLVEQHQNFAWSIAYRIMCNEYDTEEVVQEAFIKVWKHIGNYKAGMKFSTWLYKIVVNLCYDRLKTSRYKLKSSKISFENSLLNDLCADDNPESELTNKEQGLIIKYLTQQLTPKQKIVFVLSELEEFTVDEIASITGLTPAKIKSNLYCARRELREKLIKIEKVRSSYAI